jgi:signal transduction histidine kinase
MTRRLHRRWMLALAVFSLAVTALFALFAAGFAYTVEDKLFERVLEQEASALRAAWARGEPEPRPANAWVQLHRTAATLPPEVAARLAAEPGRREVAGAQGRHYHLQALEAEGRAPWLVAEVSGQLLVRPMRREALAWGALGAALVLLLALLLGHRLARRVSAPLETLAARVAGADPAALPREVAAGLPDDEVGAVGRAFDALLARTRAFVEREQAFTRDASHELRTPLAVLRLGLERQLQAPAQGTALQRELAAMHAATLLMQQTVETLLMLAREGALHEGRAVAQAPAPLLPLVEHWVLAHERWLQDQPLGLEIALTPQDRLALPVSILQLAIAALLGNAFGHGRAPGAVRLAMQEPGVLCITNPADPQAPAPGPLDEGAPQRLGLAILHRLLAASGGRLELESRPGEVRARVFGRGA